MQTFISGSKNTGHDNQSCCQHAICPLNACPKGYAAAAAQAQLGVPAGTIKATVLIETLPAAFEMDEILYELRQHSAGLNCGRWDYIFSFIKTMRADPRYVMPDRFVLD